MSRKSFLIIEYFVIKKTIEFRAVIFMKKKNKELLILEILTQMIFCFYCFIINKFFLPLKKINQVVPIVFCNPFHF